jgi:glycosyltransferase involved in cell wall biosynthesis
MSKALSLDLVVPVLNEENTLVVQIEKIVAGAAQIFPDPAQVKWQVVIADNGSTDRTAELSRELTRKYGCVRCVSVGRKGVGLALKTAWGQSNADIVGYADLDLATDLEHLKEAVDALTKQGADIVYATRLHRRSVVRGRKLIRAITSRAFNWVLHVYLRVGFSDGMCGFKFLWRKHLEKLMANGAVSDGWFFATEVLVVGEWLGLSLFELPVKWTDDPDSRVKIVPLALAYLKAMRVLKRKRQAVMA